MKKTCGIGYISKQNMHDDNKNKVIYFLFGSNSWRRNISLSAYYSILNAYRIPWKCLLTTTCASRHWNNNYIVWWKEDVDSSCNHLLQWELIILIALLQVLLQRIVWGSLPVVITRSLMCYGITSTLWLVQMAIVITFPSPRHHNTPYITWENLQ